MNYGPDPRLTNKLQSLATELRNDHIARKLDAFGAYLYGVVLKRLDLLHEALYMFIEAIHEEPLHWGAWIELAALVTDRIKVIIFLTLILYILLSVCLNITFSIMVSV